MQPSPLRAVFSSLPLPVHWGNTKEGTEIQILKSLGYYCSAFKEELGGKLTNQIYGMIYTKET